MSDLKWKIKIKTSAKGDLKKLIKGPFYNSFKKIILTLQKNPYQPTQSFEKLTPPASGFYSRRINGQHRVVYTINNQDKIVEIYSCWSHYHN